MNNENFYLIEWISLNTQSCSPVVITLSQYSHWPDEVISVGAPQLGQFVVDLLLVPALVKTPFYD